MQTSNAMIRYIDCHTTIGALAQRDPLQKWSAEHVLEMMERCHIDAALVTSSLAVINPDVGNPQISEICSEHPRFLPCWSGLPHHTGEVAPPEQFVAEMEAAGVRALKLYPKSHCYAVDGATLGGLLGVLAEAGILMIFDAGHYPDAMQISWSELAWVCDSFPHLAILLHGVRWESTRILTPLMDRFANLHIEFSNYQGNRMLEFYAGRVGAERVLFGSESPLKSPGAARSYVDYADLTLAERQKIAGGNLLRLLGEETAKAVDTSKPAADAIMEKALQGRPIEELEVIDAHAHIVQKGGRGAAMVAMNAADATAVVERNRRIGVARTCVSAWTAIWADHELGNRDTLQAMHDFPEEIVGYAAIHPLYVADWQKTLKYYYEECGFTGIKPYYPRWRIPYNDPLFDPWYAYGNRHRLYCLLHYSDNFMAEVRDLAARYPEISFLLAHSGTSWQVARSHTALAKEFGNVYLELTFTSVLEGVIEYMVNTVGSERVLYGSDAPMRDPFPQFGWVAFADISQEDKYNILGRNMARILARVNLPRPAQP
ncbi:amidohydrolase family protein [candidate division KSB1 bacterium]|nr:amidohydrolase family protein [candidate division KSB1 bacterium]